MAVKIGSARSSYGNTTRGDQHGGKEVSTQNWYLHSKGWRVFRAKDPEKRRLIAKAMEAACKNDLIGYSQPDRLALFNQTKTRGYNPEKVTEPTNCDCSSLVRVCCYHAGITPKNFITSTEPSALLATGEFVELTDDKYTTRSDYLCAGDILDTKTKGHTVVVITDGPKAEKDIPTTTNHFGDRDLKNGCEGEDVKELQTYLIQLGYPCGDWGADGVFGDATEMAVRSFQSSTGLIVDGIISEAVMNMINNLMNAESTTTSTNVVINDGSCYVREEPNTDARKLGVAYKGTSYIYANDTSEEGWLKILFKGTEGWVSGKYGCRV